MERDIIQTGIGSYRMRKLDADERAVKAIEEGNYWGALIAVGEAMSFKACIDELEFQLEDMEVSHD